MTDPMGGDTAATNNDDWRTVSSMEPAGESGLPANVTFASPWKRLAAYLLDAVLFVVTLYIGWLIWAAVIGGRGQTPGKKLLGLRVIRADNLAVCGLGRMFWARGVLAGLVASIAAVLTLGIVLLMPFWDKRNQNLWDKISSTYVVNDPQDAWGR